MANGAQALIESLRREGVTHMFGYAGATICEAVDALKASDIQYTLGYNLTYILPELIATVVILCIPSVMKALGQVKAEA